LRMKRLIRVARIDAVDVYFHWSTMLVGGLVLIWYRDRLELTLAAVAAYLGVAMIHEWGHVVAARRRRCVAWSIEIYPILGLTRFSAPVSFFDACVIAWGGVLAQLAIAVPLVVWVALFGVTPFEPLNAALAILGPLSLLIAMLNLVPLGSCDGAKAWSLIPMLIARAIGADLKRRPQPATRARKKKWVH